MLFISEFLIFCFNVKCLFGYLIIFGVIFRLWELLWVFDLVVFDKKIGLVFDMDKICKIEYKGKYFKMSG